MIGKQDEYKRMYEAETQLWWYRILHQRVAARIKNHFGNRTDLSILDAGCGTGGLLEHLRKQGYGQVEGFDFSTDGVAFSQERGLAVSHHDLRLVANFKPQQQYDVIVCNDVFTYFDDKQIIAILQGVCSKLKPNGLFITNNNAHAAFAGIHDIVVGGQKRFVKEDMLRLTKAAGMSVTFWSYWSLLLSPLIMVVRAWQRFQLRRGWIDLSQQSSDVAVPPVFINEPLYWLVKIEEKIFTNGPFGSSIFIEAQTR